MSCSLVFECMSDTPITSKEIEERTGLKRTYISGCLASHVKSGKIDKEKVVKNSEMGHRCKWAYTLAKPKETVV